jgi:hypothetical protein
MVARPMAPVLLPLLLACGSVARAGDTGDDQATTVAQPAEPAATEKTGEANPEAQPTSKKKWEFATIGYVWFAGAKGETDVIGPVAPVGLDLSFGDVLKAFKFAFMGAAEAKHDRLVFLGDLMFIHLDTRQGIGIRDPDFLKAELDSRTAELTVLGGYRVVNNGPMTLDLLAGGRMNWFKTTLQLEGPNREAQGEVKKNWLDPLIAARVRAPLGGKWSAALYGDVGGFGVASDITWQAVPTINYQISRKITLGAGWRVFKVHYEHGDFLYNVRQSGPLIVFRTDF